MGRGLGLQRNGATEYLRSYQKAPLHDNATTKERHSKLRDCPFIWRILTWRWFVTCAVP